MKVLFLILLLLLSQISYSQSYEYRQPLIIENESSFDFNNKKRYKDSFFKNSLPEFNFLDSQYKKKLINEKEKKDENALDDSVSSRIRFAAFIIEYPYTIQYVHSSGLGIGFNDFKINEFDSGGAWYDEIKVFMVTPSYTFFLNKFSIGFGFSRKSGERTRISGCTSYHVCYDDKVELSPVELRQFIISYDIFENYELLTGISFLSYDYRAYDYSDDNDLTNDDDYDLSEENVNLKLHLNMGFGYKF